MKENTKAEKKVRVMTKEKVDIQEMFTVPDAELSVAGQSIVRTDARQKVTGALKFCGDFAVDMPM